MKSNRLIGAGFKGGDNSLQQIGKGTTHTHADQGSFVLDMAGARWAEDLGADSYSDYGYARACLTHLVSELRIK